MTSQCSEILEDVTILSQNNGSGDDSTEVVEPTTPQVYANEKRSTTGVSRGGTDDEILAVLDNEEDLEEVQQVNEDFLPEQVMVCCVYWDCTMGKNLPQELVDAMEHATENNLSLLVCGDFNAHSVIWGSPTSNNRGMIVEEASLIYNLCVLNEGSCPTYQRANASSIIDVCFGSNDIAKQVTNWHVSDYATFSDHNRIEFQLLRGDPNIKIGRNLKKVNWLLFREEVDKYLDNVPVPDNWNENTVEGQAALIESAIEHGLDEVAPLTPRRPRERSPGDSPKIQKAELRCRKARNKMRRKGWTESLHKRYREACHKRRRVWRRHNAQHYHKYVSEIPDAKGAAQLMRSVRREAFVPPTLLRNNGSYTNSKKETIGLLMDTHFPGSLEAQPELEEYLNEVQCSRKKEVQLRPLRWIDVDKTRRAIKSFSDFKACGPDGVKPIVLKHLPEKAIERLVAVFTACIQIGYTPKIWRMSRTVFIPKSGKEDYTVPKSFRPISLTSFCFKTLERLVLWHFERTTFRRKPMHERQHAFRKGHSTEVAMSQVVDRIEKAILNKQVAMAAFLDIEGAFDNLDSNAAIKAMTKHGIEKSIVQWYGHYLKNRISTVQYGHRSEHRTLTRGTPQGGVLSPILWNLAFDSLLSQFNRGPVQVYGYADDACLISTAWSPAAAKSKLQDAVDKCTKWGTSQGLRFSPKKTVIVLFHRRPKMRKPTKIQMYGTEVNYSETARYLGVHMDSQLRWRHHFKLKVANAKALLFKMRNALGVSWGLKPHLLRWVYTGIVRPAISYGSVVWAHSVNLKSQLKELRKLHGLILRMICPKRRSTPIAGMEMICYIPPLELFLKGEAVKSYLRTRQMLPHDWPSLNTRGNCGHMQANEMLIEEFDVPEMEWDRQAATLHFDNNFVVEEESMTKGEDISPPSAALVYSDGSRIQDGEKANVGSGFIVAHTDANAEKTTMGHMSYQLPEYCSVYQAETTAMHRAAMHLLRKREANERVTYLLTDSKSLVMTLQRHWSDKKTIACLLNTLNQLGTYTDLRIRWIKAHAQAEGNNKADILARCGASAAQAQQQGVTPEVITDVPAPYSYLVKRVEQGMEKQWTTKWTQEKGPNNRTLYRQTKHFFRKPNKNRSYELVKLDKETLGTCMQFITGHARMNRHQNLIDTAAAEKNEEVEITPPRCRLCKRGEETPFHLIIYCDEMVDESRLCLGPQRWPYDEETQDYAWTVHKLLKFLSMSKLQALLRLGEPGEENDDNDDGSSECEMDCSDDSIPLHPSEY